MSVELQDYLAPGAALPPRPAAALEGRRAAAARLARMRLPGPKDEEWRGLDVRALVAQAFPPAPPGLETLPEDVLPPWLRRLPGPRLAFVNGRFSPTLSRAFELPAGARLVPLATGLQELPAAVAAIATGAEPDGGQAGAFDVLNTALFEDGACLFVPDEAALDEPVQLVFVSAGRGEGTSSHPRNLLVLGRGARARVLECYLTHGESRALTNAETILRLGEGARCEHTRVQDESRAGLHLARLHVTQRGSSVLAANVFSFGKSPLARNEVVIELAGEGAACRLDGLYLGDDRQQVDHRTSIEHVRPGCRSRELFKGILGGAAKGLFRGRVRVHARAARSDASQNSRNLLLSPTAVADARPQLEIDTDDVKCAHGAAVGRLDADSLFYLRSRGIGLREATAMLTHAFATETLARVGHPGLRSALDTRLRERLETLAVEVAP